MFKANGSTMVDTPDYRQHLAERFANWRLKIDGMVANPMSLSISDLLRLPRRTQITRHDCVEGWSAIGKWQGPQLGAVLARAGLLPSARYIVFHCADRLGDAPYYESIDLIDAFHPQTILAYEMNDQTLPIANGAPLRLRVELQLGYKMAKYVMRIEAVDEIATIRGGQGGFGTGGPGGAEGIDLGDMFEGLFGGRGGSSDQLGYLEGAVARFGRTYTGEPDVIADDPELHARFLEATDAAVRAYTDLLERAGRAEEARAEFRRAAELTENERERALLHRLDDQSDAAANPLVGRRFTG